MAGLGLVSGEANASNAAMKKSSRATARPLLPISRAKVFCEGLDHPECLAVHPDGSIWAGGEAGQIYRVSADGSRVDDVASTGGFILGIAFSPDCSWLAA